MINTTNSYILVAMVFNYWEDDYSRYILFVGNSFEDCEKYVDENYGTYSIVKGEQYDDDDCFLIPKTKDRDEMNIVILYPMK